MDASKSDFLTQCQSAFGEQMRALMPIWTEDRVAVAVSGGADSLALLFLLDHWRKSCSVNLSITALTIDHQLRPESRQEAQRVTEWLRPYQINHQIMTWDHGNDITPQNIQMRARQARYDLLFSFCRSHQIPHLFLAHHQQDQVETVIQRIARGTGISGLAAMSDISWQQQIRLCRPLLGWPKHSLTQYLQDIGQDWVEDPSNDKQQYDRVKWRYFLPDLAEKGLTAKRLAQLGTHAKRSSQAISSQKQNRLGQSCRAFPWGAVWISPDFAQNNSDEIDLRCLSDILMHVSGRDFGPRFDSLQKLLKNCRTILGQTGDEGDKPARPLSGGYTLHGCIIQPYKKGLLCYRETQAIPAEMKMIGNAAEIYWDRRFFIKLAPNMRSDPPLIIDKYDPLKQMPLLLKQEMHQKFKQFPKKCLATLPMLYQGQKMIGFPSPDENIFITLQGGDGIKEGRLYWRYDPSRKLGQEVI